MLNLKEKLAPLRQGVSSVKDSLIALQEKAGSVARVVGGAATTAAGVATRSTGLQSKGMEMMGKQPEPDTVDPEQVKRETETQKDINYKSGYASDDLGNRTTRLDVEERRRLAALYPEAINEILDEPERVNFEVPESPRSRMQFIKDFFKTEGSDQIAAPIVAAQTEPQEVRIITKSEAEGPRIKKENLVFQEANVGDGLPYVKTDAGEVSLGEAYKNYKVPTPQKPLKRVVITDPKEGQYIIDKPEQLAIANEIKAIADEIAPEYTNYLLKLAQKEGGYNRTAFRGAADNPGGGDDRGIFQINSKFFPTVTDEMAQSIPFSVMWALSLIESTTPVKGDGKRTGQEKWIADEAVRRSNIEVEYE